MIHPIRRPRRRRGVATVEFALVLPFLLLLLLGMWEVGRMLHIQQSLSNAAREGGRQASTGLLTNSQVQQVVLDYLNRNSVPTTNATVTVVNVTRGGDVTEAVQMDKLQVDVSVPVQDFRWVNLYLVTTSTTRLNAQTVWYSYKDQEFPNTPDPMPGY
jgi:Flp pilus assembly protein TadG